MLTYVPDEENSGAGNKNVDLKSRFFYGKVSNFGILCIMHRNRSSRQIVKLPNYKKGTHFSIDTVLSEQPAAIQLLEVSDNI